jgi:hypothetical protein
MLEGEDVLRFCIEQKVSIEQYFFMYLIARKDFHLADKVSLGKQYMKLGYIFKPEDIRQLEEREFIDDFNQPGKYYPEMYLLKEKMLQVFATEEMGEELWDKYPATFRLNEKGSRFIARAGGDKDELITLYLKKINYSTKRHLFVMEQLPRFISLVDAGEINGYKIGDFIRQELWDTIAQIMSEKRKGGSFGRDI